MNLAAVNLLAAGHPICDVSALNLQTANLALMPGGADFAFDAFCGCLADEQAVGPADVIDNGLIHLVTGHPQAMRVDDPAERDDANLGRAAANV